MIDSNTIQSWLKWADISLYLSKDDLEQEKYITWIDETKKCRLIYLTKEALRFAEQFYVGTTGCDRVATYLYSLIGQWLLEASSVSGDGIVLGLPVLPTVATTIAGQIELIVVSGGTLQPNDTVYTNYILKGCILIVAVDGVILSQNLTGQTTYTFNSSTGTITFSDPLQNNQVILITYIFVNNSTSSSVLTTEDGIILTTEDGVQITT
jgi:hypothetical protein